MTTHDEVIAIIAAEAKVSADAVAAATSLKDLKLDSLLMIDIIMAIEEKLGMTVDDSALRDIQSISDFTAAIDSMRRTGDSVAQA